MEEGNKGWDLLFLRQMMTHRWEKIRRVKEIWGKMVAENSNNCSIFEMFVRRLEFLEKYLFNFAAKLKH